MQVKFFFLGPPPKDPKVLEGEMNRFMGKVEVVQVLHSSATFYSDQYGHDRVETVFTVVYN